MPGHPSGVGHAEVDILVLEIEDQLGGQIGADHVPPVDVLDRFRLARRARGIEKVQGIFSVHHFRGADRLLSFQPVFPVNLFGRGQRNPRLLPADNDDFLDARRVGDGFVHDRLEKHDLAPVIPDVGRDDHAGLAVFDPAGKGRRAEAGIDYGMNGPDAGARQHGHGLFRDLGEVNGDPIALAHAERLQGVGAAANLPVQLGVGEDPLGVVLSDPDQRHLVLAPGLEVPVQAVVRDVARGAHEPLRPGVVPLEDPRPRGEPFQLAGGFLPEAGDVLDGLRVGLVIVFDPGLLHSLGRRVEDFLDLQKAIDFFFHGVLRVSLRLSPRRP